MKNKPAKFDNDDYSRMAGPDFKELPFEIGNNRTNGPTQKEKRTFNGGVNEELKDTEDREKKSPSRNPSIGPDEATKRDLGIED